MSEIRPEDGDVAMVPLSCITLDPACQSRARLDPDTVNEYADLVRRGADFPPVVLYDDGRQRWLASGFHRYFAHKAAGRDYVSAVVRPGALRDAVLFSASCNQSHGLRRTSADKRRSVGLLLADPEWAGWPNRRIAGHCGVSEFLVRTLRAEQEVAREASREPPEPPPEKREPGGRNCEKNADNPSDFEAKKGAPREEETRARCPRPLITFGDEGGGGDDEGPAPKPPRAVDRVQVPLTEEERGALRGKAARLVHKLCRVAGRLGVPPEGLLREYRPAE